MSDAAQASGPVDDGRLEAVRESIDEAKAAVAGLHDRDALGDVGDEFGSGRLPGEPDDGHGAFEPSGDGGQAGENPSEGADADTPGEAGDGAGAEGAGADGAGDDGAGDDVTDRSEHRDEPESVEQFDGPGPNPL